MEVTGEISSYDLSTDRNRERNESGEEDFDDENNGEELSQPQVPSPNFGLTPEKQVPSASVNDSSNFSIELMKIQEEQSLYLQKIEKEQFRADDLEAQLQDLQLRLKLIQDKTRNGRLIQENERTNQKILHRLELQLQASNSRLSIARNTTLANKATIDALRREKMLRVQILNDLEDEIEAAERKVHYHEKELLTLQEKKKKIEHATKVLKTRMLNDVHSFSLEIQRMKHSIQQSQQEMIQTIREKLEFSPSASLTTTTGSNNAGSSPPKFLTSPKNRSPRSPRSIKVKDLATMTFEPISPKSPAPWRPLFGDTATNHGSPERAGSTNPIKTPKKKNNPMTSPSEAFSPSSPWKEEESRFFRSSFSQQEDGANDPNALLSENDQVLPPASPEEIEEALKETEFVSVLELLHGVDSCDELVFRLYAETQEKHEAIENMEIDNKTIEAQLHEKLKELHHLENNHYRLKRELEENIETLQNQSLQYYSSYHGNLSILNNLLPSLKSLLGNIALEDSVEDQRLLSTGISDRNLLEFLGLLEQRIDFLIQISRAANAEPLKAEDFLMKTNTSTANKMNNGLTATLMANDPNRSSKEIKTTDTTIIAPEASTAAVSTTPRRTIVPSFLPTIFQEDDEEDLGYLTAAGSQHHHEEAGGGGEEFEGRRGKANSTKLTQHIQPINIVLLKDIMNRKIQKMSMLPVLMGQRHWEGHPQPSTTATATTTNNNGSNSHRNSPSMAMMMMSSANSNANSNTNTPPTNKTTTATTTTATPRRK